jgi:general secretion pathway protein J
VLLLRPPYRLSFAYAGPDRIWQNTWRGQDKLPAMVKLTVRDSRSGRVLSVSTVTPVHVQAPSDCVRPDGNCDKPDKPDAPSNAPNAPADSKAGAPAQGVTQ